MAYVPPLGIPAPTFGIDEVAPSAPANWPSAEAPGYYYVDKTVGGATDTQGAGDSTNPRYGYPNKPRLSIPTTLAPGSYVEVHGTGYTLASTTNWTWVGNAPNSSGWVFVKGVGLPDFTGGAYQINKNWNYVILDGLKFINFRFRWGATGTPSDAAYNCIRNCDVSGWNGGTTTSIFGQNTPATGHHDIVLYTNYIHDNGAMTGNLDQHGCLVSSGMTQFWYLNNHSARNGGDSIQIGAATAPEPWANNVYVGGNEMHGDRENAVDVKQARDIIISENKCYDYASTATSLGECMVFHNGTQRIWIIGNEISNAHIGIVGTGQTDAYVLGNIIHDCKLANGETTLPSALSDNGAAIANRGQISGVFVIQHNTVYDCERGLHLSSASDVRDNIIVNLKSNSSCIAFDDTATHSGSTNEYNIFTDAAGVCRIQIGAATRYTALTGVGGYITANPTKGTGCQEADPLFINPAASNFNIPQNSPACNTGSGSTASAYDVFNTLYGRTITKDSAGTSRPQQGLWDIGALEFKVSDIGFKGLLDFMGFRVGVIPSGTTYPRTLSGTLTFVSVAINRPAKLAAGAVTSAGTNLRNDAKTITGNVTPAGASAKSDAATKAGTLTESGTVAKQTAKPTSGGVTFASVLSFTRVFLKTVTGALTSAGALAKSASRALAGTLTSNGTISRALSLSRTLVGTLTFVGATVKLARTTLSGTLTSSAVTLITRAFFKTVTGALTSAGTLAKNASRTLTGNLNPSGVPAKRDNAILSGALSGSGVLAKLTGRAFSGAVAFASSLTFTRVFIKIFTGSAGFIGNLVKSATKVTTGTQTPAGSTSRSAWRTLAGSTTLVGTLASSVRRTFAGALTSASSTLKQTSVVRAGAVTAIGTLRHAIAIVRLGIVASFGQRRKHVTSIQTGAANFSAYVSGIGQAIPLGLAGFLHPVAARLLRRLRYRPYIIAIPIADGHLIAARISETRIIHIPVSAGRIIQL